MNTSSLDTTLSTIFFPETFCTVLAEYRSAEDSYLYIIDSSLYYSLSIWVMYSQTMCCPLVHLFFLSFVHHSSYIMHCEARSEAHYPHRLPSSPTLLHRDRHPSQTIQYRSITSTWKTNLHIRGLLLPVTASTRTHGYLACMPLTSIPQVVW